MATHEIHAPCMSEKTVTNNDFEPKPIEEKEDLDPGGEAQSGDAAPLSWSRYKKWSVVLTISLLLLTDTFATTTLVPAAPQVLSDLKETNQLFIPLLVSIWELGEGIGPFVYAPLSEIYGRAPVFHVGNALFVGALAASAASTNMSMLISFRFIAGLLTTCLVLGPAIVGDIFPPEERGTAMALNTVLPLLGPLTAPIVGGAITAAKGWRWSVWVVVIAAGALALMALAVVRETYAPLIRSREKAQGSTKLFRMRQTEKVVLKDIRVAMMRPITTLFGEKIVFVLAAYTAVSYGINYLIFTSLTAIMQEKYAFSEKIVGLAFLPNTIGNLLAMAYYAMSADRYLAYRRRKTGTPSAPGDRLIHLVLGAVLLPPGLLLYGWSVGRTHWIVPLIGTALVGISVVLAQLPTENYLVDAFGEHAASAVAAALILRSLSGAFFPLLSSPVYGRLGLAWGNTLLGGVAALWIPIIVFVWKQEVSRRRE